MRGVITRGSDRARRCAALRRRFRRSDGFVWAPSTTSSGTPGPAARARGCARPASAPSESRASGSPGSRHRRPEELAVLRDVAAAASRRHADLPQRLPTRLGDDAADRRGAGAVRVVRGGDRARRPRDPRHRRRQRAEPEPLLAAAVRRDRRRRGRAGLLRAARGGLRRREGGRRGRQRSGAARSRRAGSTGPAPAATRTRPRRFIRDLGAAYRASGRTKPALDGFAFHPYPASSSIPPDRPTDPASTSILLADYEEKLAPLLDGGVRRAACRSSTASSASRPRFRPRRRRSTRARNRESRSTRRPRRDYYRRAIELASCQKDVVGLLLFHSHDERALTGFQSGVYYVDGTPKASLEPVRKAIEAAGC